MRILNLKVFIVVLVSVLNVSAQYENYIWQTNRTSNLDTTGAQWAIESLRTEVDKILASGHLAPLRMEQGDVKNQGTFFYWEPGRIITTLAMAYPYLTPSQQQSVKTYVNNELSNANYTPWASGNFMPAFTGARREYYTMNSQWSWNFFNSNEGSRGPTRIATLYGLWLYAFNSGDWAVVSNNWSAIKNFYSNNSGNANLYGTMSAHIAMARMAYKMNDSTMQTTAVNNATSMFNTGKNFTTIENNAKTYYSFNYNVGGRPNYVYHGWMFLNVTPEIGRYLRDADTTLKSNVLTRHNSGKSKYPLWWLHKAPYFAWWTWEEGIGLPVEIIGMIFPIERWVVNASSTVLAGYSMDTNSVGIGDCYTLEALVYTISSYGTDVWVDVRTPSTPTKILLSANPTTLTADGISISTVTATVCDANNIPVTDSTATVTFSLSGSAGGTLVGTNPVQAVNGVATIRYRSGTNTGTATVTGTSQGLTQGSVDITLQQATQPTITVTYPNGGETWQTGTTQTVTWTSQGSVGNVNIDLSTDGGSTWTNLVSNTANDGSQTVTVPNTPSSTCRIRVQEPDGSPSDTSNNNFTISAPVQPTITVISPNGGETWQTGTTQTVLWSSQGTVGNVNIDLSTDGGTNWTNLVSNTPNDGSQTITVPNTPSSTCRIRVREPDGTPSDTSDNNFTISTTPPPPGITVIYPNGGETWTVGETRTVQWTSQGSVGNVNIDLSTNSGSTWTTLVSNTANDGSQTITVPNTPSSTCRIRVQEPDGSPSDISNTNFTIKSSSESGNPILMVSTKTLDFGELAPGETSTLTFDITNIGSGTLTGTLTTDQEWLTVDPPVFNIPGQSVIQTINVTVDNSVLNQTEGEWTGKILIDSNGGTVTVDVILTATCVLVKPNPYNPNKGLLTFFGDGIVPGETTIKIYTLSGELVKQLRPGTGKEIVWDGKAENGEPVASGIYLYTYESPKEKGIGKFTVIIK